MGKVSLARSLSPKGCGFSVRPKEPRTCKAGPRYACYACSYPKTAMSWFFCTTPGSINDSTGQGSFLIQRVTPKNSPPDVNCYSGTCQGEAVWQDPNAFAATESEMQAQCVPNH